MTKLNRSIERGLLVLKVVHGSGPSSLSFISAQTGLSKPTLLRICATLENQRWLTRRSSDGQYQLGTGFPNAGGMLDLADRLVSVSKEAIVKLSDETGLGVDLAAAIGGGRVEIVDTTRVFKKHGIYSESVGYRPSPFLSALGSAYFAALSTADRAEALHELATRLTREDVAALPRLPNILRSIESNGYSVRAAGHWGRAVDYGALPAAIGSPVLVKGKPIGAVNLVWDASKKKTEEVAKDHLGRLRSTAKTIAQRYADPA
ncbi:helix-turn-helix domain-containing protein [uncultured Paracoccus sp.]|uniref:IclR family transcriptional regulator n=1 Tax=uncultured Paracoccus sp. TaxID=189685 RepID=UPI00262F287E|nr:helix-turn-helix domain-containing protein [uncultured Paracoccus sp.]HMQ12588.1 helix-turn-helix domain-containing protein [Candidatus Competibacter phosphatis]